MRRILRGRTERLPSWFSGQKWSSQLSRLRRKKGDPQLGRHIVWSEHVCVDNGDPHRRRGAPARQDRLHMEPTTSERAGWREQVPDDPRSDEAIKDPGDRTFRQCYPARHDLCASAINRRCGLRYGQPVRCSHQLRMDGAHDLAHAERAPCYTAHTPQNPPIGKNVVVATTTRPKTEGRDVGRRLVREHGIGNLRDLLVNALFKLAAGTGFDLICTSTMRSSPRSAPLTSSTTVTIQSHAACRQPPAWLRLAARRQGPRRPRIHHQRCTDRESKQTSVEGEASIVATEVRQFNRKTWF